MFEKVNKYKNKSKKNGPADTGSDEEVRCAGGREGLWVGSLAVQVAFSPCSTSE